MRAYILAVMLGAAGCAGEVGYTATVSTYGPDLVYAAPGVQVIADWNEPIFFTDGLYWRWDGSTWYRSTYYTGGWAYAPPPAALLRIDSPHAYVRYRPTGWTPRDHRREPQPPIVRDHRDNRRVQPPPPRQTPYTYPAIPPTRQAPPPRQGPPPAPPRDERRDKKTDWRRHE